jgi:hypothetical protein
VSEGLKEAVVACSKYYPGICKEEFRKTIEFHSGARCSVVG